jgi:prepilin peptidase CpaA
VDATACITLSVALVACVVDLRTRRIPNALTFAAAAGALLFHAASGGWGGLGRAAGGGAIGLALFLPFFLLRGLGGGDVKLLAALGAWLGPAGALSLAVWSMIAGGPMALVVAAWRGYAKQAIGNVRSLVLFWRVMGLAPHPTITLDQPGSPRLPYSLPIAVGLMVTIWRG